MIEYLTEAAAEAARIARGVKPDQLGAPTPCTRWDVAALVNHWVLYTSHGLECRARRMPVPEARGFARDTDWADAYAAQLDKAVAAWRDPAAREGEIDLGFAHMAADGVLAVLIKEMIVHGWDVAAATGQRINCSPGLAGLVLATVDEHAELYRQYDGFADPVPVSENAPVLDRALARSGREPGWAPPPAA
jgi:uncharacterized protein (TIGR03086 family)